MTVPFQERLDRLAHASDDAASGGRIDDRLATPEQASPLYISPNRRIAVIGYALVGIMWMYPTGWVLGRFDTMKVWLPLILNETTDVTRTANLIWMLAMGSFLLFCQHFRALYWYAGPRGVGRENNAIYIGEFGGLFFGYGIVQALTDLLQAI